MDTSNHKQTHTHTHSQTFYALSSSGFLVLLVFLNGTWAKIKFELKIDDAKTGTNKQSPFKLSVSEILLENMVILF